MNKLLKLMPRSRAGTSLGVQAGLLVIAGMVQDADGVDPNMRMGALVVVGICILLVHLSGVRSNPDGNDVRAPYRRGGGK